MPATGPSTKDSRRGAGRLKISIDVDGGRCNFRLAEREACKFAADVRRGASQNTLDVLGSSGLAGNHRYSFVRFGHFLVNFSVFAPILVVWKYICTEFCADLIPTSLYLTMAYLVL
jgi:hypothetical protein